MTAVRHVPERPLPPMTSPRECNAKHAQYNYHTTCAGRVLPGLPVAERGFRCSRLLRRVSYTFGIFQGGTPDIPRDSLSS